MFICAQELPTFLCIIIDLLIKELMKRLFVVNPTLLKPCFTTLLDGIKLIVRHNTGISRI